MLTYKEAMSIVGSELGEPSKMPGFSFGLPAKDCIVGSKLRNVENSTCSKCYAFRGNYMYKHVTNAQDSRAANLTHPQWVEAMVFLIQNQKMRKNDNHRYFRWHDSGDLQSIQHLTNICEICNQLESMRFWCPTREYKIVEGFVEQGGVIPKNLVVRLSGHFINGPVPRALATKLNVQMSTVHTKETLPLVKGITECRAYTRSNQCGPCRSCWNKSIKVISYLKH